MDVCCVAACNILVEEKLNQYFTQEMRHFLKESHSIIFEWLFLGAING
jgi:hypothetical protein